MTLYVRQTNRETKENQRDKKGNMLLLFNKVGKRLCVRVKAELRLSRMFTRVTLSEKCIFNIFGKRKVFHKIFRCKVYFVNYIIPVLK